MVRVHRKALLRSTMQNETEDNDSFKLDDQEDSLLQNKHEDSIDVMFYAPLVNYFINTAFTERLDE